MDFKLNFEYRIEKCYRFCFISMILHEEKGVVLKDKVGVFGNFI